MSKSMLMQSSVPLITDELRLKELLDEYLNEKNDSYTVIGCVGVQGSGKSTLLSMLAGNNPRDKYRQYIFRPCSKDTVDAGFYQTAGLHIYITSTRMIYIDCSAVNCGASFEEMIKKSKSDSSGITLLKNFQSQTLSLMSVMFEICHTLLLTVDWFIDINAVQELLRAALYSEFNLQKFTDYPKTTNLVIVHQRVQVHDYEAGLVKERSQLIRSMFKDSRLNVCGGISMAGLGFSEYYDCEPDVNYVLLDELPQWTKEGFSNETKLLTIPYGVVVKALRTALNSLAKNPFRTLKTRRPLRRARRAKECMAAPTVDREMLKLNEKQNEVNRRIIAQKKDDAELEPDGSKAFCAEQMPNIAFRRSISPKREPWNENLGLSVLSPPESEQLALNSLELLRLTYLQRSADDYVKLLLPDSQPKKFNEKRWFEYVRQILEITARTYETRYFISNNGRLVPRIIRKLRDSTKVFVRADEVSSAKSGRRGDLHKQTRNNKKVSKARNATVAKRTDTQLLDGFASINLADKSAEEPETRGSTSAATKSKGSREREQSIDKIVDSEGEFSSISAFSFSDDDENNVASDLSLNSSDDSSSSESSQSDRGVRSERRGFRRRVVSNES